MKFFSARSRNRTAWQAATLAIVLLAALALSVIYPLVHAQAQDCYDCNGGGDPPPSGTEPPDDGDEPPDGPPTGPQVETFSVSVAVSEPATSATMLLGIILIGVAVWAQRRIAQWGVASSESNRV